jgi:hypothetical protein
MLDRGPAPMPRPSHRARDRSHHQPSLSTTGRARPACPAAETGSSTWRRRGRHDRPRELTCSPPLFPVYGCRFRNPPPSTERASGWGRERLSCRAAVLVTVAPAGCLLPREWVNQQIDSTGRKQHLALLKLLVFKTHKVWVDHGYAALLLLFLFIGFPFLC